MTFHAQGVVDGSIAGHHTSRRLGPALDFVGHRPYAPGDDRRRIDWRVAARRDRWIVREDCEETNIPVTLALDVSASMAFGDTPRPSKIRAGARLLAGLAYLLIRQRESIAVDLFSDQRRAGLPASARPEHLGRILHLLDRVAPAGKTDLTRSLDDIGEGHPRRGTILVVSDFQGKPDTFAVPLRRLIRRSGDLRLVQVLDPSERELPASAHARWRDLESDAVVSTDTHSVGAFYRTLFQERLTGLEHIAHALGIRLVRTYTDEPPARALARIL